MTDESIRGVLAYWPLVVVAVVALVLLLGSIFTVQTAEAAIVQRFGKFHSVATAGLNFKAPFIDSIVTHMDLMVEHLNVQVQTKTKDNVFVTIPIAVQYRVLPDHVYDAFYKLSDHTQQITSFVYNVILGHVPNMNLDEVFLEMPKIAIDLQKSLNGSMSEFGYEIVSALITDVVPDAKVADAMNDINAAAREREATVSRAETNKMLLVKTAEADSESKRLQGEGIANQRKAIVAGLQESVEAFSKAVKGATAEDAMAMVLMTQYFDTLKEIGAKSNSNTLLLPHTPNALSDLMAQFRTALLTTNVLAEAPPVVVEPKKK